MTFAEKQVVGNPLTATTSDQGYANKKIVFEGATYTSDDDPASFFYTSDGSKFVGLTFTMKFIGWKDFGASHHKDLNTLKTFSEDWQGATKCSPHSVINCATCWPGSTLIQNHGSGNTKDYQMFFPNDPSRVIIFTMGYAGNSGSS